MSPDASPRYPLILVVEHDSGIRLLFEDLLTEEGYWVLAVPDVAGGLALAEQVGPDLILLDLGMPGRDGVSFARAYHQRGGTAPIVLCTATTGRALDAAVEASGAVARLIKPFEIEDVLATIARCLAT